MSADNGLTENTYTYDANGNRDDANYDVGDGNRLTTDGVWNYFYDNEGNLTKRVNITETEAAGITWTYAYDNANHLIQAKEWSEDPDENLETATLLSQSDYVYDVFGNRLEKIVDADGAGGGDPVVSKFAYDGWNNVKSSSPVGNENWDVIADLDDAGSLITRYMRGDAVDQLFARIADDGDTLWNLTDQVGSVRDVIDNTGAVVDNIAYDGFGGITESDPEYGGRYKYTSREFDAETGLQFNRARYYDAETGRWISQDPLGFDAGDSNLYRYVNNRPTQNTDPSGKIILAATNEIAKELRKELIDSGAKNVQIVQLPSKKWYVQTDSSDYAALFKYANGEWPGIFDKQLREKDKKTWLAKYVEPRNLFLLAAGAVGDLNGENVLVQHPNYFSTPTLTAADKAVVKTIRDRLKPRKVGADIGGVDRYVTMPGGHVVNINVNPWYVEGQVWRRVQNFIYGDGNDLVFIKSKSIDKLWAENSNVQKEWAGEMLRIGKSGALITLYAATKQGVKLLQDSFLANNSGLSFTPLGDYLNLGGFGFSLKVP